MTTQEFTGSEIVIDNPVYSLHKFSEGRGTPVLVTPPFAGRGGGIAQRMIEWCVAEGKTVYAYELKSATQETKGTSVKDLINIIDRCQQYIGQNIDLIGLCQGGWVSTIYTALHPQNVNKLAILAAPINTKTDPDNVIEKYMQTPGILPYHKNLVAMNNGIQSGMLQWFAFSMVKPSYVYYERWVDLFCLMISQDTKGLEKWNKNNTWHDSPQDLAGTWFLECLEHHFLNNELYNGEWIIGGKRVDMSNITCPCYMFAGEDDEITGINQVFDMRNKVGVENSTCVLLPNAGHTRVFTGKKELDIFRDVFFYDLPAQEIVKFDDKDYDEERGLMMACGEVYA